MKSSTLDPTQTKSYDYILPSHLIASYPLADPRDGKLLIYKRDTQSIIHTTFHHIFEHIPKECAIFLNDTKVIKARIFGKKESGGGIELLVNKPYIEDTFVVFIKGKVKENTLLFFPNNLYCRVLRIEEDGARIVAFYKEQEELKRLNFVELIEILEAIGHIPLPHYLDREDEEKDSVTYQTLFAKNYGAVAAPTASLHFTEESFATLQSLWETYFLTLHVGAGTFKPVDSDLITDHPIHSEYYAIPKEVQKVISGEQKILAIGTTVTRTIEYFNATHKGEGEANIFLHPLNPPKRVEYLLTNFHLPKSTLIMLVASFIGLEETLRVYTEAIEHEYRFFSYGDGMLIL